jgi:hypothetical protein
MGADRGQASDAVASGHRRPDGDASVERLVGGPSEAVVDDHDAAAGEDAGPADPAGER